MDRLRATWRWLMGEIRPPDTPLKDSLLLHLVGIFTCFALFGGDGYHINDAPVLRGSWLMGLHGGIPLAGLVLWGLVRNKARPGTWVAALAGLAMVGFPMGARMLRGAVIHNLKPHTPLIFGGVLVGMGLLLLAARRSGTRLSDFGIGLGDWRWWLPRTAAGLLLLLVGVPAALLVFPDLQAFYPAHCSPNAPLRVLLGTQLSMAMAIFGWEMLFRGTLLFVLARRGDVWMAIEACAIAFFMGHFGKPMSELALSLPGGILAGMFAWRARSFLPIWALHAFQLFVLNTGAWLLPR